ncbi:DUF1592 domain-containing protein [Sandaracinus amylolyticus]|uniref:Cellulose-binding domain protein n=1 Tax=Sandaracinus amylolyticus TaxID=927083 RepID=A0A0F6W320_9BACT|nr:DUF1592 domain-containing protein [Sandaracinus amylolyticus]AKF06136.1 Cellulose-binding domain protein [Sandaracinus amylolyticus]
MQRLDWRKSALVALAVLAMGCAGDDELEPAGPSRSFVQPFDPGPRVMQRLTRAQYVNAVRDLFGEDVVVVASALEPDAVRDGFFAIGAAQTSVSSRGVEQYERAAYQIASQVLAPERRERIVSCAPSAAADETCAREVLAPLAQRAWRRPVIDEELTALVGVAVEAATVLEDFHAGLEYALAAILQSPDFLYRPQTGVIDEGDPSRGTLDAYELATRLSFFFWNTIPDDALLAAAQSGALDDPEGLDAEIDRLLESPRARAGIRAFADDWLQLGALEDLSKDPMVFTAASPDLGPAAREGTLRTIEHFVFDLDGDYRDLMTTRETFVDRRLAALYVVRAPASEGFGLVELPESSARRGLLGQASILAMWAHPVSTSPTLRGRFVREALLCQQVLPPPVGVDTAIPEPSADARTLRERLASHRENEFCAGCHAQLDPIGLGLEQFDGVGRFRTRDEDVPIDASGELDGVAFADASELALALRGHPALVPCFVDRMMTYAGGHVLTDGEDAAHQALTIELAREGYRVRGLMRAIARHPFFRGVSMVSEEGTP